MKRLAWIAGIFFAASTIANMARADEVVVVTERYRPPIERPHFYMGVEGIGNLMLGQTGGGVRFLGHGGGPSFFLGGRVNRVLAIEWGFSPGFYDSRSNVSTALGRNVSDVALTQFTLDAKFFPVTGRIQPYLALGPSLSILTDWQARYLAAGPGWQAGVGIDFWVAPMLSLGLKAQYRGASLIKYDPADRSGYLSMLGLGFNITGRF